MEKFCNWGIVFSRDMNLSDACLMQSETDFICEFILGKLEQLVFIQYFPFLSLSSLFSIPNMKSNSSRLCECELLYLSEVGGQRHSILFAHMKLALKIFFFSLKIC